MDASKSCDGKRCYTKRDAQTMRNAKKREGKLLRIYPCKECGGWHLTHKL
jgi:hypothetical protein